MLVKAQIEKHTESILPVIFGDCITVQKQSGL